MGDAEGFMFSVGQPVQVRNEGYWYPGTIISRGTNVVDGSKWYCINYAQFRINYAQFQFWQVCFHLGDHRYLPSNKVKPEPEPKCEPKFEPINIKDEILGQ